MGEEIMANGFSCSRSLRSPTTEGFLPGFFTEGHYPDTRLGPNWNTVDPHINATVLGHWYFLLSQGGSGTNGIGNPFNVSGIGISAASEIAYNTELALTPSADFSSVRVASIAYATQRYGANSCEVKAVIDAWRAVGVGNAYSGNLGLLINGDDNFCTVSNSYSISNLPAGATVSWSTFPLGVVYIGSPNSTTTTLTKSSDGFFILKATVSNLCGDPNATIQIQKSVIAGPPPAEITGPYDPQQHTIMGVMCTGDSYYFTAYDNDPGSSYTWTLTAPPNYTTILPTMYSGSPVYMSADSVGTWTLQLAKSNTCGTTITTKYLDVEECYNFFTIIAYPNPAKGNIKVTIQQNDAKSRNTLTGNVLIELYNFNTAARQKQWTFAGVQSQYDLNIAQVPKGIYILRVSVAGIQQSTKLVVE